MLAWIIGLGAGMGAWTTLSGFRQTPGEISLDVDRKPDLTESERAHQKDVIEAYTTAYDRARNRILPLEIAQLLVGMGMFVFSQRAAAGRGWARQALVQLTVAHVLLLCLAWALTPELRRPELELVAAWFQVDPSDAEGLRGTSLLLLGIELAKVATGALMVVGLTLRGSRAFYETTPELAEP